MLQLGVCMDQFKTGWTIFTTLLDLVKLRNSQPNPIRMDRVGLKCFIPCKKLGFHRQCKPIF